MSGNGIRCLVQAAHRTLAGPEGKPATYTVDTDAGERTVSVESDWADGELYISVDMGRVSDLTEPHNWDALGCNPDRPVRHVSMGNPHSVVGVDDVAAVDLAELGQKVPHVNLEIIEPGPEPHAITMRVHERGAGITMACGTGACAAAEAAVAWGLVPATTPEVIVHMDGGDAKVRVDSSTRAVTLIGPAVFIASISVPM
jgi:diaminopimelate epimerase